VATVRVVGPTVDFAFGPPAEAAPDQLPEALVLLVDACFRLLCDCSWQAAITTDYAAAWARVRGHILRLLDHSRAGPAAVADDCVRRVCETVLLEAVTIMAERRADPPTSPCFALAVAVRQGLDRTRLRLDAGLRDAQFVTVCLENLRIALELD
jgi:hypothetical protein